MKIYKTFNILLLVVLIFVPSIIGNAQDGLPSPQSPSEEELSIFLPVIFTPRIQSIFGVETYNFTSANMQTALNADIYWIRSFLFDWSRIESQPGVYNWNYVSDNSILQANKYNMQIVANIKYTPTWAQKYSGVSCGPIKDTRLADFGNFVKAMVTKYGAPPYNIHYWEFFNEPDVSRLDVVPDNLYGCWGEKTDNYYGGGYFSEMLKVAYQAVKSVDPSHKVLIGGLLLDCDPDQPVPPNHTTCKSAKFFEGILRNGAGSNFDIVSFHSYIYTKDSYQKVYDEDVPNWNERGGQIVGKINFLREKMSNAGVSKPLFMTELAMIGGANDNDCRIANESFLAIQADLAVTSYARTWGLGLMGQTWYTLDDGWRWSGLQCEGVPKPAYHSLRFMAKELKDAAVGNSISQIEGLNGYEGLRGYEFHMRTKDVLLLWTPDSYTTVNLQVPFGVTKIYNKFGVEISPIPEYLEITHPTYLEIAK